MMRLVILAACGAILVPAAASAAGQATDQSAATTTAAAQPKPRKQRMVCKTMEEKGSRLGGKRVCRTQGEWDDLAAQQKQEIERRLSLGPARQ